jgi:hypothetical protein
MDDLFKKQKIGTGEVILAIVFIIYLIMGYKTPDSIAKLVNTPLGKIIILFVVLLLFISSNPILGVLGIFVAFHLINQSSSTPTGSFALQSYVPTEKKKYSAMTQYNQFPYTLEQEVVKKMAPLSNTGNVSANESKFSPVLDNLHDAAPIHYKGVI